MRFIFLILIFALVGCTNLQMCGEFSQASQKTFDIIGQDFITYANADKKMTEKEITVFADLTRAWQAHINVYKEQPSFDSCKKLLKVNDQIYKAIASRYLAYVDQDSLSLDQKKRRIRLVKSWKLKIEGMEKAYGD